MSKSPSQIASDPGDGCFFEDFNRWSDVKQLEEFVRGTRLSRIAACLMRSPTATLFHDHILVKEKGTSARTPWHQDQPYYDIEGEKTVSFWIPTEHVDESTSLEIVSGTHHGPWYTPRTFKSKAAKWFPEGCLPECPSNFKDQDVLRYALEPGDVIAFHFLAVHGAPGVRIDAPRRPVYSLRLVGSDCVFCPRPWRPSPDLSPSTGGDSRVAGQALSGPLFPVLYTCPVNLSSYPIVGPPSKLSGLVARCRAQYLDRGAVVLPGFLTAESLAIMSREIESAVEASFVSRAGHNVYLDSGDPSLPSEHPRNAQVRTVVGSIAYDLLPRGCLLKKLYAFEPLLDLVKGVLGLPELHRLADGIGCCTVNVFRPGDEQGWHYDETEFSVTLMLAEAEKMGEFEYLPALRREGGSREEVEGEHAAIEKALAGNREGIEKLALVPGALAIFKGHTALHRVTTVAGSRTRLVAVLAFCEQPGIQNSEAVRELFWGRKIPLLDPTDIP